MSAAEQKGPTPDVVAATAAAAQGEGEEKGEQSVGVVVDRTDRLRLHVSNLVAKDLVETEGALSVMLLHNLQVGK